MTDWFSGHRFKKYIVDGSLVKKGPLFVTFKLLYILSFAHVEVFLHFSVFQEDSNPEAKLVIVKHFFWVVITTSVLIWKYDVCSSTC